jgi:hypothetical protein
MAVSFGKQNNNDNNNIKNNYYNINNNNHNNNNNNNNLVQPFNFDIYHTRTLSDIIMLPPKSIHS